MVHKGPVGLDFNHYGELLDCILMLFKTSVINDRLTCARKHVCRYCERAVYNCLRQRRK